MIARVVIPLAVTALVAFGAYQLSRTIQRQDIVQTARIAELESYSTRSHLSRSTETMLDALHAVREFWDAYGGLPRDQWRSDAYIELDHFDGIERLLYRQSENDVRFLRSSDHPGYAYRPDDKQWATHQALLARLAEQTESTVLGPYRYPDGRDYIEIYIPEGAPGSGDGLVALIDPGRLIDRILMDEAPSYAIEVFWGDERLYARGSPGEDHPAEWDKEGFIRLSLGPLWRVVHRPTQDTVDAMNTITSETVLALGSVIATLLGLLTYESARTRRRAVTAETAERKLVELNRDLESIVEQRTKELRLRNSDLQTISDSMAHDLRNSVGAISMNVQVLKARLGREGSDPASLKAVERIEPQIKVMSDFLDRLMGISALAHETFERTPLDMRKLFGEVYQALADAEPPPPAELRMDDDLPDVEADELLVRVLITNLLTNALKYTRGQPRPWIRISHRRIDGVVEYTVRDNGVGFDVEETDHLFAAFERLSQGERFEGTGLGLTIVARVIDRHEGIIRAEGAPGEGAAFHFTLEPSEGSAEDAAA